MIARRLVVHGHVQGVGFRDACARAAHALGLDGWVRNRPDGTVEILVQGAPAAVQDLVAWAHQGPAQASVARVEVAEETPGTAAGFRVAR